jgi:hypothetical protein
LLAISELPLTIPNQAKELPYLFHPYFKPEALFQRSQKTRIRRMACLSEVQRPRLFPRLQASFSEPLPKKRRMI